MNLETIAASLFALLFVILGFLIIYVFRRVFLVEITSLEYYLLSAVCSALIYFIAFEIYVSVVEPIATLDQLVQSILDQRFILTIIISWLIVFFFCLLLYRIRVGDILRKHFGRERGIRIVPDAEIWDDVLRRHPGFLVVITMDNKVYYGAPGRYSLAGERMLQLYYPRLLEDSVACDAIDDLGLEVTSILFFEDDIRRIYLIPKREPTMGSASL